MILSKTVDLSFNSYLTKCDVLNKKNKMKNVNKIKSVTVRLRNDKDLNFSKTNKAQSFNTVLFFLLFILLGNTSRIKMLDISTIKNINDKKQFNQYFELVRLMLTVPIEKIIKKDKVFVLEFKITSKSTLLHFLDLYFAEISKNNPLIKKGGSQLKTNTSIFSFKEIEKLSNSEKYGDFVKDFNLEIIISLADSRKSSFIAPFFLFA